MTAKIITFGISKGGASKSTSSGITAWILSQEARVLCIDMDVQGNLTSFLTNVYDICDVFYEKTVLEALREKDVRPFIYNVKENLDIVPSNDFLAALSRIMYQNKEIKLDSLTKALEPVMEDYDYIIIDTPPSLGEHTLISLSTYSPAGSYVVIMFDGSLFSYYAIPKFMDILNASKQRMNDSLQVAGILFAVIDFRAKENSAMEELVDEEYPGLRFETAIKRKAATRRIPIDGFEDNREITDALEFYYPFVKELKERVQNAEPVEK